MLRSSVLFVSNIPTSDRLSTLPHGLIMSTCLSASVFLYACTCLSVHLSTYVFATLNCFRDIINRSIWAAPFLHSLSLYIYIHFFTNRMILFGYLSKKSVHWTFRTNHQTLIVIYRVLHVWEEKFVGLWQNFCCPFLTVSSCLSKSRR